MRSSSEEKWKTQFCLSAYLFTYLPSSSGKWPDSAMHHSWSGLTQWLRTHFQIDHAHLVWWLATPISALDLTDPKNVTQRQRRFYQVWLCTACNCFHNASKWMMHFGNVVLKCDTYAISIYCWRRLIIMHHQRQFIQLLRWWWWWK